MVRISALCGGLLTLIGVGFYAYLSTTTEDKVSVTALIPAFAGVPILLLTLVSAMAEKARKHAMHVIAMLALLGVLLPLGRLAMNGFGNPTAAIELLLMAVVSGVLLGACIQSFRAARKARQQAEAEAKGAAEAPAGD